MIEEEVETAVQEANQHEFKKGFKHMMLQGFSAGLDSFLVEPAKDQEKEEVEEESPMLPKKVLSKAANKNQYANEIEQLNKEYLKYVRVQARDLTPLQRREDRCFRLWKYIKEYHQRCYEMREKQLELAEKLHEAETKGDKEEVIRLQVQFGNNARINAQRYRPDEEMVRSFFEEFRSDLWELPSSARNEIFLHVEAETFTFQDHIVRMGDKKADLYLIGMGQVINIKTENLYKKFVEQQQKSLEINQIREEIGKTKLFTTFSGVTVIGMVIVHFIKRNPALTAFINLRKQALQAKEFEEKMELLTGSEKLISGDSFGDYQEVKGRKFIPSYAIAQGVPTRVFRIPNLALRALFSKNVTPENVDLVARVIGDTSAQKVLTKKLCRCFVERVYPMHTQIIKEDQVAHSMFLVKSGTVELISKKDPLKSQMGSNGNPNFIKLPITGEEVCLGVDKGFMSKSLREFHLSLIGEGQWIADDAVWTPEQRLAYGATTKTNCILLEIGIADFRSRMPKDYHIQLKEMTIDRTILKLTRMQDIIRASGTMKEEQEMRRFFDQSLAAITVLHPFATKRIVEIIADRNNMDGVINCTKKRDALLVGQVELDLGNLLNKIPGQRAVSKKTVATKIFSPGGKPMDNDLIARKERLKIAAMRAQEESANKHLNYLHFSDPGEVPSEPKSKLLPTKTDSTRQQNCMIIVQDGQKPDVKEEISLFLAPKELSLVPRHQNIVESYIDRAKATPLTLSLNNNLHGKNMREVLEENQYDEDGQVEIDLSLPDDKLIAQLRENTRFEVDQKMFQELKKSQPKQLNAIQEWRYKTVDAGLHSFNEEGNLYYCYDGKDKITRGRQFVNAEAEKKIKEIKQKVNSIKKTMYLLPGLTPAGKEKTGAEIPFMPMPDAIRSLDSNSPSKIQSVQIPSLSMDTHYRSTSVAEDRLHQSSTFQGRSTSLSVSLDVSRKKSSLVPEMISASKNLVDMVSLNSSTNFKKTPFKKIENVLNLSLSSQIAHFGKQHLHYSKHRDEADSHLFRLPQDNFHRQCQSVLYQSHKVSNNDRYKLQQKHNVFMKNQQRTFDVQVEEANAILREKGDFQTEADDDFFSRKSASDEENTKLGSPDKKHDFDFSKVNARDIDKYQQWLERREHKSKLLTRVAKQEAVAAFEREAYKDLEEVRRIDRWEEDKPPKEFKPTNMRLMTIQLLKTQEQIKAKVPGWQELQKGLFSTVTLNDEEKAVLGNPRSKTELKQPKDILQNSKQNLPVLKTKNQQDDAAVVMIIKNKIYQEPSLTQINVNRQRKTSINHKKPTEIVVHTRQNLPDPQLQITSNVSLHKPSINSEGNFIGLNSEDFEPLSTQNNSVVFSDQDQHKVAPFVQGVNVFGRRVNVSKNTTIVLQKSRYQSPPIEKAHLTLTKISVENQEQAAKDLDSSSNPHSGPHLVSIKVDDVKVFGFRSGNNTATEAVTESVQGEVYRVEGEMFGQDIAIQNEIRNSVQSSVVSNMTLTNASNFLSNSNMGRSANNRAKEPHSESNISALIKAREQKSQSRFRSKYENDSINQSSEVRTGNNPLTKAPNQNIQDEKEENYFNLRLKMEHPEIAAIMQVSPGREAKKSVHLHKEDSGASLSLSQKHGDYFFREMYRSVYVPTTKKLTNLASPFVQVTSAEQKKQDSSSQVLKETFRPGTLKTYSQLVSQSKALQPNAIKEKFLEAKREKRESKSRQ